MLQRQRSRQGLLPEQFKLQDSAFKRLMFDARTDGLVS